MSFISTFGRLPRTWVTLALMVVSGIAEGFGIALFVPVLELLDGQATDSWLVESLRSELSALGVDLNLPVALGLVMVLIISAFGLYYIQVRMLISAKFTLTENIRQKLFQQLIASNWEYLSKQPHGEVVNILATESTRYGQSLVYQVRIVATVILVGIYSCVSAMLSWKLLALVLALGTIFLGVVRPFIKRAKSLGFKQLDANRRFAFNTVEFLKSSKLIKITAADERVNDYFAEFNNGLSKTLFDSENINEQSYFILQSLPVIAVVVVILMASQIFLVETAYMLVFLAILARTMPRVAQMQQYYQQYLLRRPAIDLIDGKLRESEKLREETHANTRTFGGLENEIVFENVSFNYPSSDAPALNKVNLKISKNQLIAFVGRSGSGKSTLIDLLAGLRKPTEGALYFDDANIESMDLASLRQRIGYVTQEITVFNDTVRNNLLFARPDADDETIHACLKMAHLDGVVEKLPNGLDTVLEESGTILSGGERQRLALARALMGKPDILLLDEATSALDNESERIVRSAIREITSKVTVVVVAHRLSSVQDADMIYVLDNGSIIEQGTFNLLINKDGVFADLNKEGTLQSV